MVALQVARELQGRVGREKTPDQRVINATVHVHQPQAVQLLVPVKPRLNEMKEDPSL